MMKIKFQTNSHIKLSNLQITKLNSGCKERKNYSIKSTSDADGTRNGATEFSTTDS